MKCRQTSTDYSYEIERWEDDGGRVNYIISV